MQMRSPFCLAILGEILLASQVVSAQEVDFNRDIRPILSAACLRCHGFDSKKREGELRLDLREGAVEKRGDHPPAVLPGDPDASPLMARILSTDSETVMPPPDAKRQLTNQEKDLLREWIRQGAKYQLHWSFEPIRDPVVKDPSTKGSIDLLPADTAKPHLAAWKSSNIDKYLFQELLRQGLEPQPEADRRTLIRRVSFTLTGLPPTLSEVLEFESDRSENAYERMVDRYLKSEHYGEEMARHWLDVARYGDTHGLHLDNERQMWAYRDWVVQAFNENMPFSQFTIEQLAGDLLPSPTHSQLVATGFNRCNVTTSEGGAINEEFLYRYAVDRTSTTIQTWLGLTGGCAVCHDHKYDPLTMRDFYSMYAFFYSAEDPAMDGNIDTTSPFQTLPSKRQEEELQRLREIESNAKKGLVALGSKKRDPAPVGDVANETKGVTEVWLDDTFPIGASLRNTSRNAARWTHPHEMEVPMGVRALVQSFGDKYEQTVGGGLTPHTIPEEGQIEIWVRLDAKEPSKAIFLEVKTNKKTERWGWANTQEDANLVNVREGNRLGVLPKAGQWTKLKIDLSGAKIPAGALLEEFKLGQFGGVCYWDGLSCSGTARAKGDLQVDFAAWVAERKGKETPLAEGKIKEALKAGPESEQGKEHADGIRSFFDTYIASQVSTEVMQARGSWMQARVAVGVLENQIPGSFIFRDLKEPRKAHIMTRGQYDQKGDEVEPATPSFLPQLVARRKEGSARPERPDRLDLARWLVDESHPLPARVTVNRFWQQVFGAGIVRTSEDFGSQGNAPSHPELLEHLAFEFRSKGWNVKQLMKELVMTSAFRQSSTFSDASLTKDPENRYLARGPRIRLDAEQVRDNALAVSGLLNRTMGGPGAKSYQPPNIWEPVGYGDSNTRYYVQDHGDALYRRSLYCFLKRTAPPPFMSNFDAPNREMFCSRRERSNTPLQALQLMNDTQHFEAARKLAERAIREAGTGSDQRIRFLFEVVLARVPAELEQKTCRKALAHFESRVASHPEDAEKIIRVGESTSSSLFAPGELAAYTLLSNLILNLDETVVRN